MTTSLAAPASIREQIERDLARGTSDLPTLPKSASEALHLARQPELDLLAATQLAERDPPLAARFVAVANSVFYSRGIPIVAPRRAIQQIGGTAARDVLFQAAYASMLIDTGRGAGAVESTFLHGVVVAHVSRDLAVEHKLDPDIAFLAGLLHDIGRARCWKLALRRLGRREPGPDVLEAIDALHAQAGAALARAWKLPAEVADVCAYHHEPAGRPYPSLVGVADAALRVVEGRGPTDDLRAALAAGNWPQDRLERVLELAFTELDNAKKSGVDA
jgi:putative nucleotidyltransferase with HDIG domain